MREPTKNLHEIEQEVRRLAAIIDAGLLRDYPFIDNTGL
jgi:hypothetical protein